MTSFSLHLLHVQQYSSHPLPPLNSNPHSLPVPAVQARKVSLQPPVGPLSAGRAYQFSCSAEGSLPPADLRWSLAGTPLPGGKVSHLGYHAGFYMAQLTVLLIAVETTVN